MSSHSWQTGGGMKASHSKFGASIKMLKYLPVLLINPLPLFKCWLCFIPQLLPRSLARVSPIFGPKFMEICAVAISSKTW